jgi:hypothetical protein
MSSQMGFPRLLLLSFFVQNNSYLCDTKIRFGTKTRKGNESFIISKRMSRCNVQSTWLSFSQLQDTSLKVNQVRLNH